MLSERAVDVIITAHLKAPDGSLSQVWLALPALVRFAVDDAGRSTPTWLQGGVDELWCMVWKLRACTQLAAIDVTTCESTLLHVLRALANRAHAQSRCKLVCCEEPECYAATTAVALPWATAASAISWTLAHLQRWLCTQPHSHRAATRLWRAVEQRGRRRCGLPGCGDGGRST